MEDIFPTLPRISRFIWEKEFRLIAQCGVGCLGLRIHTNQPLSIYSFCTRWSGWCLYLLTVQKTFLDHPGANLTVFGEHRGDPEPGQEV